MNSRNLYNQSERHVSEFLNRRQRQAVKIQKRSEREEHIRSKYREALRKARKEIPKQLKEYEIRIARSNKRRIEAFNSWCDVKPDSFDNEAEDQGEDVTPEEQVGPMDWFRVSKNEVSTTLNEVATASSNIGQFAANMNSRLDQLVEFFKGIYSGVLWRIPIFLFALAVCHYYGVGLGCLVMLMPDLIGYIGDLWYQLPDENKVEEQSGVSDIAALIATVVLSCVIPQTTSKAALADVILRRAGGFDRSIEGFKKLFETMLSYSENVINVCIRYFGGSEICLTDTSMRMLRKWAAKVDQFEVACTGSNPTLDQLREAIVLQIDGIGFRQVLKTPTALAFCNRYVEKLGMLLQARRGAMNEEMSFRQAPLMGLFGGPSAVGKTTLLKMLGMSILIASGETTPADALVNLWQKGTTEYWNGYVNQKCLIMDDAFQIKKPDTMGDSEFMTMIRAVGSWAFPLNFADLESKGRFYFNSPLILGTTNVEDVQSAAANFVSCPEAVTRRISHGYWVRVSPEYQTEKGTLDYSKLNAAFTKRMESYEKGQPWSELYPWDAWIVTPHAFDGAVNTQGTPICLKGLVVKMASELKQRRECHKAETMLTTKFTGLFGIEEQAGTAVVEMYELDSASHNASSDNEITTLAQEMELEEDDALVKELLAADAEQRRGWALRLYERSIQFWRDAMMACRHHLYEFMHGLVDLAKKSIMSFLVPGTIAGKLKDGYTRIYAGLSAIPQNWKYKSKWVVIGSLVIAILAKARGWAVSAVGLAYDIADTILQQMGFRPVEQSNVKPDPATKPKTVVLRRKPDAQSEDVDPNKHVRDHIYENNYGLFLDTEEGRIHLGSIQFIEGQLAVMPYHFYVKMQKFPNGTLKFVHVSQNRHTFTLSVKQFFTYKTASFKDMDVLFVSFGLRALRAHHSIRSYLMSETNMTKFMRASGQNVSLMVPKAVLRPNGDVHLTKETFTSEQCNVVYAVKTGETIKETLFEYSANTIKGDCGAPLLISDNRFYGGQCFLGQHVAGFRSALMVKGYASVITEDMVREAQSVLSTYKDAFISNMDKKGIEVKPLTVEEQDGLVASGLLSGSFLAIGRVDKPVSIGTSSSLRQSPMGEDEIFGPAPKAPAILRSKFKDGKLIYPMVKGMEAYQSPLEERIVPGINAIAEAVTQPFREATKYKPRIILTPEEAVLSIEGLKLKKIARDTSAGYPYSLTAKRGKADFFGVGQDYTTEGPAWESLKLDVLNIIENAKNNERSAVVFTDFLKDELRPLKKVEDLATRCISAAPVDYVIATRMYFGAIQAAMFSSCIDNFMAPGINPYTDWARVASKILSKGKMHFAGDFSRFDASEQPYVHDVILNLINAWYRQSPDWKEEDDLVRTILWMDLTHSRHLTGLGNQLQFLIQWSKALPSGHPLTTLVNSFYSLICLAVCYVHITGDLEGVARNVYFITFGDDNIVSPSEGVIEVFNQITVSEHMMSIFGLVYTSDKKDQELVPWEPLDKITFLQRSFREDMNIAGGFACPLNETSFLYVPYWYRNKLSCADDMMDNIKTSLGELSQHPEELWESVTGKLYPWLVEQQLMDRLPFSTREAAREWMSLRQDCWY